MMDFCQELSPCSDDNACLVIQMELAVKSQGRNRQYALRPRRLSLTWTRIFVKTRSFATLVRITSRRQATFPARVLDAMGVGQGNRLELQEGPDGYLLRQGASIIDYSRLGTFRDKIPDGHPPFDIRTFSEPAPVEPRHRRSASDLSGSTVARCRPDRFDAWRRLSPQGSPDSPCPGCASPSPHG